MSVTTQDRALWAGIDDHRGAKRLRMWFGKERFVQVGLTPLAALALKSEWAELKARGLTPASAPVQASLAEAAESLLNRKKSTVSRKTKRKLTPRGIEFWERSLRPWREGEFSGHALSALRRAPIEDWILERAVDHATSARNELQALKALLEYAGDRGAEFEQKILRIDPVICEPRVRLALGADELEFFARRAPDYAARLILNKGTTGMRSKEMFTLTDDRVDLNAGTYFVPAALCKEGRDKHVQLTEEEVALTRAQLGPHAVDPGDWTSALPARAGGTSLVYPKKEGSLWASNHFDKLVWTKTRLRAREAHQDAHDLPEGSPTPYDGLRCHDLRSTAATMMRDAGFSREAAAARLGHADSGKLLDRVYDQGDRNLRVRREIDAHASAGLRATLRAGSAGRAVTLAAANPASLERK